MKYIMILFASLTTLFAVMFWILFTQSGNNIVKPYIQNIAQEKLQKDVHIEAFILKTNFIDAEILIDKTSKIIVNGNFNIWKNSFDLDYVVDSEKLQTPYININEPLHVEGKVVGNAKEFQANGEGNAFRSNVTFAVSIKNEELQEIKLKAKNVKIEDVLALLNKPIYSKGVFDVDIDAKAISQKTYKGNGHILIHYGTLDNNLLEKDFALKLAQILTYKGNIKANIDGDTIYATSDIFSNFAKIQSKKTKYDIKNEVFYSDYQVHIPNLGVFEETLGMPIQGNILIDGNIQKDKKDFSFDANAKTLGGSLRAIVFNDTFKADLKGLELASILNMFKKPQYSEGKLTLNLDMTDTKKLSRDGKLLLHVENAKLYTKEFKEMTSSKIINYNLTSTSNIKNDIATMAADINSDILTLKINESELNLDTNNLEGKYILNIEDLDKLFFVTNRALSGDLKVGGTYSYLDNKFYIDGNSEFLEGKTKFDLKNNIFNLKSDELSIASVSDLLRYPRVFDSFANLNVDYNLTSEQGIVNLNALNGKLLQSEFTNLVLLVSKFDLTQEVYKDSILRAIVDKKKIDFSVLMNGLESYVKIPKGFLDLETNVIDSDFEVQIQNKDFKGNINGTLEQPEVSLDNSEYIKHKLDKAIDKNVPEKWREPAKELLKLFG